jgi:hypothetical protein
MGAVDLKEILRFGTERLDELFTVIVVLQVWAADQNMSARLHVTEIYKNLIAKLRLN